MMKSKKQEKLKKDDVRLELSSMFMQSMISNGRYLYSDKEFANQAVKYADALIEKLGVTYE